MDLIVHQKAVNDLEKIWLQSFHQKSKEVADEKYALLISALRQILNDFSVGKSVENIRDGYRILLVDDVEVFYRADLDDCVEVVRFIVSTNSTVT